MKYVTAPMAVLWSLHFVVDFYSTIAHFFLKNINVPQIMVIQSSERRRVSRKKKYSQYNRWEKLLYSHIVWTDKLLDSKQDSKTEVIILHTDLSFCIP